MATKGSGMSKHDKYIFAVFCSILFVIGFALKHVVVAVSIVITLCCIVWLCCDDQPKITEYKPLDLNGNGAHD